MKKKRRAIVRAAAEQYGYGKRTAPPAGEELVVASTNTKMGKITYNLSKEEIVKVLTGKTEFKVNVEVAFNESEAYALWAFIVEHETLHQENLNMSESEILAMQAAGRAVVSMDTAVIRQNQGGQIASTSNGSSSGNTRRGEGKVFGTAEELIGIFDAEYKGVPGGMLFEQGGFLAKGAKGWVLYMPSKTIRLKAATDIGRFSKINFGFYGMNRAREEGILVKVSERVPTYQESVLTQGKNISNGKPVLQTKFFTAEEIILHNGESFAEFILKLGHNGDLANLNAKTLKAMLAAAKYIEPEIDNTSGDITDEYKYVPLVLEIEALGSPREILHGQNWRRANRTNQYVHTHLPTDSEWNDLIRSKLNDERDELNTPPDILGLRHDIARLNAPRGASSSIVTFEYDKRPRILRTFMLDRLSARDANELLPLAVKHRLTLNKQPNTCKEDELRKIVRFYELVKAATVNGLPDSAMITEVAQVPR